MKTKKKAPAPPQAAETEAPIIIIGGGLAGMMTALMLARSGHGVMLLAEGHLPTTTADTATADTDPATMTASMIRTTTLNPFAFGLLGDLGMAASIRATPIHRIEVSDGHPRSRPRPGSSPRPHPGFAGDDRLLGWDSADDAPLAYTAYNHELITAAARCIEASPRITYRGGIRITGWQPPQAHAVTGCLHDAAGRVYRCGLAVACDGGASPLRDMAGIKTISRNPRQTALVALIRLDRPHQHRAWQRFLEGGPLALMPLDESLDMPLDMLGLASLVWTLDEGEAERLMDMDEAAFNAALNEAAQSTNGGLALASPRHGWPLRLHYTPKPYSERLVLVGDAAHAIHPLAGQGFNLAMGDAAGLAAALGWGRAHGLDMGDAQILERYARGRLIETAAMTMATHGLHLLFSTAPAPLRAAAAMGMALLDRSPLKGLARGLAAGGLNRRLHHFD